MAHTESDDATTLVAQYHLKSRKNALLCVRLGICSFFNSSCDNTFRHVHVVHFWLAPKVKDSTPIWDNLCKPRKNLELAYRSDTFSTAQSDPDLNCQDASYKFSVFRQAIHKICR